MVNSRVLAFAFAVVAIAEPAWPADGTNSPCAGLLMANLASYSLCSLPAPPRDRMRSQMETIERRRFAGGLAPTKWLVGPKRGSPRLWWDEQRISSEGHIAPLSRRQLLERKWKNNIRKRRLRLRVRDIRMLRYRQMTPEDLAVINVMRREITLDLAFEPTTFTGELARFERMLAPQQRLTRQQLRTRRLKDAAQAQPYKDPAFASRQRILHEIKQYAELLTILPEGEPARLEVSKMLLEACQRLRDLPGANQLPQNKKNAEPQISEQLLDILKNFKTNTTKTYSPTPAP